ncbi:hypothetical protein LPJ61_001585 [Coemansia biformis]|uniref:Uncharacterized protein n=1 Tax=Coemansia biformis TaxID=1286918 RepID=A0A9W7YGL5_9FUNG|nr:hypothetical protein LPJ61_001585 [Coemansia biformis]
MDGADENGGQQQQLLVGLAGKERIKRMMSQGNPAQAIADFGAENGLDMPAADAIYALLDSLGHSRREVHSAALEAAVLAMQRQIQGETLPHDQFIALLARIVHYLDIPQLQHLPLLLLARRPQLVPPDIRQRIRESPALYERCSAGIKRELWHQDHELFRNHMLPLIRTYAADGSLLWMSREIVGEASDARSIKRRENAALVDIVEAIDADLQLYMQTLGMVRELFVETHDPALGTLRLDLVMAVHDKGISKLTGDDLCYGLAWPLDACISKQSMDNRRVLELQKYFDRIDRNNAPYGEIALILCSPYSRHILAQHILAIIEEVAISAGVHDRMSEWKWPSLMLSMGLSAYSMILQEDPEIPKLNNKLVRQFFESMYAYIEVARKHDRMYSARLQQDDVGNSIKRVRLNHQGAFSGAGSDGRPATMEDCGLRPAPDAIAILESMELARQVLYAFVLRRAASLDIGMVNIWLPVVADLLPAVLGLAGDSVRPGGGSDQPAASPPPPPEVALPLRMAAFEIDAFVQSLVSRICASSSAVAVVLNQACAEMDRVQDQGGGSGAIEALETPLVRFLARMGRTRHCGHEQTVVFLEACTRLVSAGYNGASAASEAAGPSLGDSAAGGHAQVSNKESAVYFVFQFAEHAAASSVVDPAHIAQLKELYARLASASPQQAFKYRICRANCPATARFLD